MECVVHAKNKSKRNSNREPTYGYIEERIEKGENFRDPKGKAPVNYGNIMDKLNISRNDVEREAANQGLTIAESQFEVKRARRGRPKKDTTAADTSDDESPQSTPKPTEKKRGRPKKEKQVVSANTGDDLIKDLVKEAYETTATPVPTQSVASTSCDNGKEEETETDSDSEGTLEVEKITINGKEYLKSSDNTIYDVDLHTEIGRWNPLTKKIEPIGSSDED